MRITNRDQRYTVDRAELTRFMRDRGFTGGEMTPLCITINPQGTKDIQKSDEEEGITTLGKFHSPNSIVIYTYEMSKEEVNATIVHELSHYHDSVLLDRERWEACERLSPAKYRRFFDDWLRRRSEDRHYDYHDQPGEIRAREWEQQYGDKYRIVCTV